jgi:hypothetical protein
MLLSDPSNLRAGLATSFLTRRAAQSALAFLRASAAFLKLLDDGRQWMNVLMGSMSPAKAFLVNPALAVS